MQGPDHYRTGMVCSSCRRDVAAPAGTPHPIYLYCGMERGLVPLIETEDWHSYLVAMSWIKPAASLPLMDAIIGDI
jgi:hypothetical protein